MFSYHRHVPDSKKPAVLGFLTACAFGVPPPAPCALYIICKCPPNIAQNMESNHHPLLPSIAQNMEIISNPLCNEQHIKRILGFWTKYMECSRLCEEVIMLLNGFGAVDGLQDIKG